MNASIEGVPTGFTEILGIFVETSDSRKQAFGLGLFELGLTHSELPVFHETRGSSFNRGDQWRTRVAST
ncbi:MAG: hypothetical protein QW584_01435 [Thermofilaceae archaeon]